eukprot:scaffold62466_cov20-Tisochrysis_lutea.AAC.5
MEARYPPRGPLLIRLNFKLSAFPLFYHAQVEEDGPAESELEQRMSHPRMVGQSSGNQWVPRPRQTMSGAFVDSRLPHAKFHRTSGALGVSHEEDEFDF